MTVVENSIIEFAPAQVNSNILTRTVSYYFDQADKREEQYIQQLRSCCPGMIFHFGLVSPGLDFLRYTLL